MSMGRTSSDGVSGLREEGASALLRLARGSCTAAATSGMEGAGSSAFAVTMPDAAGATALGVALRSPEDPAVALWGFATDMGATCVCCGGVGVGDDLMVSCVVASNARPLCMCQPAASVYNTIQATTHLERSLFCRNAASWSVILSASKVACTSELRVVFSWMVL